MKRFMSFLWVCMLALGLLAGCAGGGGASEGDEADEGGSGGGADQGTKYAFTYNGVTINMGIDVAPVLDALGEPLQYFEAPSCVFEGLDKIFYYNGFEIYTYPVDGVDFISSVCLTSDGVTTPEGVYLGQNQDAFVRIYGDDYEQEQDQFTYNAGKTSLSFLVEDDVIVAIIYGYDNMA